MASLIRLRPLSSSYCFQRSEFVSIRVIDSAVRLARVVSPFLFYVKTVVPIRTTVQTQNNKQPELNPDNYQAQQISGKKKALVCR